MIRNITFAFVFLTPFVVDAATVVVEKDSPVARGKSLKENVGIETLGLHRRKYVE